MKKRVYFNKCEDMRYISHLDLLRFFERLMTKGSIPVKYSQGFHPRPKISLGNPISLGTEAYNEVMDFELEVEMSNEELKERFNSQNILGFKVERVEDLNDKISIVDRFKTGIYHIHGNEEDILKIKAVLDRDDLIERKEKKGKIVERNLRDKIESYAVLDKNTIVLNLLNSSPNVFIDLAEVPQGELDIKKMGYKEEERK